MTERSIVYRDRDGVRKTMIVDDDYPDRVVVHTEQVLDEILLSVDRNRELLNTRRGRQTDHIGTVPQIIAEKAMREDWDESDWRKWWNGEGRAYRTWKPGKWL